MNDRRDFARVMLAVCSGALLGGCSLPQAQPDPTRYYVLSTLAVSAAAPVAQKPVVHLRPIELATYLKAKPMIVRRGENEIEFREYARWGEPLELGIGRVLREELLARGAASAVLAPGQDVGSHGSGYELGVRVLACEGTADGGVRFRAAWELSTTSATPSVAAHGDFRAEGLKWDGKNESALAAQLSQAVSDLSAEIAAGLDTVGK